jgi:hypothetical protein
MIVFPQKDLTVLFGLPLQRNTAECCHSYLLPVKNEPFGHVISILIFLEKFTACKRRQSYDTSCPSTKASETYPRATALAAE